MTPIILDVFICLTKVLDRSEAFLAALRERIVIFGLGVKKSVHFTMNSGYQKEHILYIRSPKGLRGVPGPARVRNTKVAPFRYSSNLYGATIDRANHMSHIDGKAHKRIESAPGGCYTPSLVLVVFNENTRILSQRRGSSCDSSQRGMS